MPTACAGYGLPHQSCERGCARSKHTSFWLRPHMVAAETSSSSCRILIRSGNPRPATSAKYDITSLDTAIPAANPRGPDIKTRSAILDLRAVTPSGESRMPVDALGCRRGPRLERRV